MNKETYFDTFRGPGWPTENWLARYFLTAAGRRDFFASGNDSWGLAAEGIDGTDNVPQLKGRVDVNLVIQGHPDLGVLLQYRKTGRQPIKTYYSKGDLYAIASMGDDSTRRPHADRLVHSVRDGLEGDQGVHGTRRRFALKHRMDCRQGYSRRRIPAAVDAVVGPLARPARCVGVGGDGVEFRRAARAAGEGAMKEQFLYRAGASNVVSEISEDMKAVMRRNTETLEGELTRQAPGLCSPAQTRGRCSEKTDATASAQ